MHVDIITHLFNQKIQLKKNQKCIDILNTTVDSLGDRYTPLNDLQKSCFVIQTIFTYSHFGYNLFSALAKRLLVHGIAQQTGANPVFLHSALDLFESYLQQEKSINLDYDFTNDVLMSELFFEDFLKKILSSFEKDSLACGLEAFDQTLIKEIRNMSLILDDCDLNRIDIKYYLSADNAKLFDDSDIQGTTEKIFRILKEDLFMIFVWRMESLVCFKEGAGQGLCFIKKASPEYTLQLKALVALLAVMYVEFHNQSDKKLSTDCINKKDCEILLAKIFNDDLQPLHYLIRWSGLVLDCVDSGQIEGLLDLSTALGFLYRIPKSKKKSEFGLTDKGLHIMRPFASVLGAAVVTKIDT